jgi:hypothetical protein
MKTILYIKIIVISLIVIILCSGTAWVDLTLIKSGDIALPENIHSIAIIDRTKQEDTKQNKVEEAMTGEVFKQDEQAVKEMINGFINSCSSVNRYKTITITDRYNSNWTKTTFPTALSWPEVDEICKNSQADAVLSIEIFDSDFLISNNPLRYAVKDPHGIPLFVNGFHVSGVAVVNLGIRIYDPAGRNIVDEYRVTKRLNWDSQGNTLQDAINQLYDKAEAVNKTSYEAGQQYAERITPSYYKVTRYFYDKPKRCKNLRAGVRKSEVADWNGAIESWQLVVDKEKRKFAGRAAFNIAVAYEVLGNLGKAKEWAAKSYTVYEDKEASNYFKILSDRMDQEKAANQ